MKATMNYTQYKVLTINTYLSNQFTNAEPDDCEGIELIYCNLSECPPHPACDRAPSSIAADAALEKYIFRPIPRRPRKNPNGTHCICELKSCFLPPPSLKNN